MNQDDQVRHFRDELQLLLDDRLDPGQKSEVEKHLKVCSRCRRELEYLSWTKQFASRNLGRTDAPVKLRHELTQMLDREDRKTAERGAFAKFYSKAWKPVLTLSAVALVAIVAWSILRFSSPGIPSQVVLSFVDYRDNQLPLDQLTSDVEEIEQFFQTAGIPFQTRVFDFAMMGWEAVGGRVHQVQRQPAAFFTYRNNRGDILVCQMYPGQVSELTLSDRTSTRENEGIQFFVYELQGVTIVFWQEGEVTCVLAGDLESEQVIQLAFAKAMKI